MKQMLAVAMVLTMAVLAGCASAPKENIPLQLSNLTAGTVAAEVVRGRTTSGELLAMFGAPNIIARNRDGEEVWNYNRMSFVSMDGSDVGGIWYIAGWMGSRAMSTATTRSFDVCLTLDTQGIVKEYTMVQAAF